MYRCLGFYDSQVWRALRSLKSEGFVKSRHGGPRRKGQRKVPYNMENRFETPSNPRSLKTLPQKPWLPSKFKLGGNVLTRFVLFNYLPRLALSRSKTETPLEKRLVENCRRISFWWVRIWAENPHLRKYLVDQMVHEEKTIEDVLKRIVELEDRLQRLTVLNAQEKPKPVHILKSLFYRPTLKTSEIRAQQFVRRWCGGRDSNLHI